MSHTEKQCSPSREECSWCLRKGILSTCLPADDSSHTGLHVKQTVNSKSGTDSKDDIGGRWKQIPVQTEDLPYQPFDPVPPHRISGFSVHTDPQPAVLKCVRQEDHGKAVTSKPPPRQVNALKIAGRSQQMFFREGIPIQAVQAANCLRPLALLLLITA